MSLHRSFTWIFVFVSLAADFLLAVGEDMALEARLTPCELIEYHGYPCETTHVTTEDGYILQVDRVPYGIHDNVSDTDRGNGASIRHPVLLVPAIFTTSDVYFLNFPWQSLGFLLADNGFDVWSMNTREAKTYASHITLSKNNPKFWRFSFDEMGRYDLPACIDHVLKATGAPKLTIVTFSQGFLANLVLHSVRPEYNEKVNLLVGYGPVANVTHIEPPFAWVLPISSILEPILYPFSEAGFLGTSAGLRQLISATCSTIVNVLCAATFTLTAFASPEQLNETRLPVYLGHLPTGSTLQNYVHYSQVYMAKNLVMYDHGRSENRRRYGQDNPPPYPLERIRLPIALFPSPGDTVATPADVADLVDRLGENVVFEHRVPQPSFRHLDFVTGYRANDILHNVAVELVRKYAVESL